MKCLEMEPVSYYTILQDPEREVVVMADRQLLYPVMADASGLESSHEGYRSHH